MLLERAELEVAEGKGDAFEEIIHGDAKRALEGVAGVTSVSVGRGVENPGKFLLLVEWSSLEAHVAWRDDASHAVFHQLIGPYLTGGIMEHFEVR